MKKIGFYLPHLGASQAAFYAINTANYLFGKPDLDVTIFYQELFQPCSKPLCATLNGSEVWTFDGILITTNINTTIMATNALSPKRRLFYVWDLEWLRPNNKDFFYNIQAYRNPKVELVARTLAHAQVIENYANRPVNAIIPDFNINYMFDYLERTNDTTTK